MKNFTFLLVFLMAVPASAYQAGQANRTNFGAGQQQPAQQQYRSFSNYNNRNWGQGVQTQGVQTEIAGKSVKELKPTVGKQQAVAVPAAKPAKPAAVPTPTQASTVPAGMPANVDPAAMMQQVQGMMNAMGNMSGGAAQQGKAGQNVATPTAMPDISALMGGAMPAVPANTATPAKK